MKRPRLPDGMGLLLAVVGVFFILVIGLGLYIGVRNRQQNSDCERQVENRAFQRDLVQTLRDEIAPAFQGDPYSQVESRFDNLLRRFPELRCTNATVIEVTDEYP